MNILIMAVKPFSKNIKNWEEMEQKGELLYTSYLLPFKSELARFSDKIADKIIYRILDGGETWVNAGRPVFIDMKDYCKETNLTPSSDIATLMHNYKFGYLKLHCGFGSHEIPPTPHPMTAGRMTIKLSCEPKDNDEPLAYGWVPKDTIDEKKVQNEITVSPKFDFVPFDLSWKRKSEFIIYKPRISVIGGHSNKITWQYFKTDSVRTLSGDREARLMVRMPKNVKILKVTVDVQATIKESFRSRIFNKSKKWAESDFKDLQDEEFNLTRGIKISYGDLHKKRTEPNFANELLSKKSMDDEDKTISIPLS